MKRLKYLGFSVLLVLMGINFIGCTGSATQIGPSTFTITGGPSSVYREASNVCRKQGLNFKLLRDRMSGNVYHQLDFKCLSYDSKEYQKNSQYEAGADVSVKVNQTVEYK